MRLYAVIINYWVYLPCMVALSIFCQLNESSVTKWDNEIQILVTCIPGTLTASYFPLCWNYPAGDSDVKQKWKNLHMRYESFPCACMSCSGRGGRPALTARAPAPHPGPLPVPEQSHLWPSSPEGGFLPPADSLPVCLIEEKHNPTVSPFLSLSFTLSCPQVCPRALLRTDPGPPSVRYLCEAQSFPVTVFRSVIWNVGVVMTTEKIGWTFSLQSFDVERSELRWADLVVLTGDFPNTEDSALCCRDSLMEKLWFCFLRAVDVSRGGWGLGKGGKRDDLKLDLKQFQNSKALLDFHSAVLA